MAKETPAATMPGQEPGLEKKAGAPIAQEAGGCNGGRAVPGCSSVEKSSDEQTKAQTTLV